MKTFRIRYSVASLDIDETTKLPIRRAGSVDVEADAAIAALSLAKKEIAKRYGFKSADEKTWPDPVSKSPDHKNRFTVEDITCPSPNEK